MIQIAPNFVIGLPDRTENDVFIKECNERRLIAMQEFGMNITEYTDDNWLTYKKLRNNDRR